MRFETALLSLIREFVQRQQLVLAIITELHPDFLIRADPTVSITKIAQLAMQYRHVPQIGIWHNDDEEWDYFFHGGGCRLTHRQTKEVIDWDPLNVLEFDPWKFKYWLKWVMKTEPTHLSEEARILNTTGLSDREFDLLMQESLNTLVAAGHLLKGKHNNLILATNR